MVPEVILTEEQVTIVAEALGGPVTVGDAAGRDLGHIEPKLTPEMIAELKRRAAKPGPRFTGAQVQARLRALQDE